jgi:phosphoglycerate-specific signal transduction histidine kinase
LEKFLGQKNKGIWNEFKAATRNFNHEKNSFYKDQKKEQFENLEKKRALIKLAEENKGSEDFAVATSLMKKIQSDWRTIGHVPRKDSDKIWKQFKEACNFYFDRIHAQKNEANKEEVEHYQAKEAFLETFKTFIFSGDDKADISSLKEKITQWKQIGRVPYNKRNIEQDFNKALDGAFAKLNLDKNELELIKFENKLLTMVSGEDDRKLQNEQIYTSKKIDESKNEIRQLENNLGFFKHVDKNNPMVKDVYEKIANHKEQLDLWNAKMSKIRAARQ